MSSDTPSYSSFPGPQSRNPFVVLRDALDRTAHLAMREHGRALYVGKMEKIAGLLDFWDQAANAAMAGHAGWHIPFADCIAAVDEAERLVRAFIRSVTNGGLPGGPTEAEFRELQLAWHPASERLRRLAMCLPGVAVPDPRPEHDAPERLHRAVEALETRVASDPAAYLAANPELRARISRATMALIAAPLHQARFKRAAAHKAGGDSGTLSGPPSPARIEGVTGKPSPPSAVAPESDAPVPDAPAGAPPDGPDGPVEPDGFLFGGTLRTFAAGEMRLYRLLRAMWPTYRRQGALAVPAVNAELAKMGGSYLEPKTLANYCRELSAILDSVGVPLELRVVVADPERPHVAWRPRR